MRKLIAAAVLALSGCVTDQSPTVAQREARDVASTLDEARRQAEDCTRRIESSAEYERLSDRFALRKPAMAILADKRRPTESDSVTLLTIHKMVAACRSANIHMFGMAHPAYAEGLVVTFAEADIEFARLVRRDISWGQYAELIVQRNVRLDDRFREASQKVRSSLNESHAAEMRDRESAQRAFAAWAAAQRANLPVVTTCNYAGAMITCQSF